MEVDAINSMLAANGTRALDQKSLGLTPKHTRVLDLSQEHTNGRMFEQAVQNANKAGETSASSSDNVKLSNSKIDQNADVKNENPLTLNQKDARSLKEHAESDKLEEDYSGEEALKQALQTLKISYMTLTQMSRDTLFVKGQIIDTLIAEYDPDIEPDSVDNDGEIKIGVFPDISERQRKRQKVQEIAEETYSEIAHIEAEEGEAFHSSVVQGLSKADFGKEVTSMMFDQPAYFIEN